ncbi:MAG TPA: hypothetical protein PKC06_17470 [Saprospiraceae bacterium]|jgi:hypothetical protein|nr:hypothetical protein [Saprospiraceae bacterium]
MEGKGDIYNRIEEADKNFQSYLQVGKQVIFVPKDDSEDTTFSFRFNNLMINTGSSVKVFLHELAEYYKNAYSISLSEFMIDKESKSHSELDQ